MTTFYLMRHGSTDSAGHILTGRTKGIHLNDRGREEVEGLPKRFENVPIKAIYATPLERTQETAAPLARVYGLPVQISEEMTEVDYGDWTGRKVQDLLHDPLWVRFGSFRGSAAIPGGESMLQIQARVVAFLGRIHEAMPDGHVVLVSHGDPIKTAVLHYLGMPLDLFSRVVIYPASVTIVTVTDSDACVVTLNNRYDRICEYSASR